MRKLTLLLAATAALIAAPSAQAAIPSVFGGDVSCAAQPADGNVRLCSGTTKTFDGVTKVDVNVMLPPAPASGPDGPYPTIGAFHGWSGSKFGLNSTVKDFLSRGYAVFSQTDRGWGNSCGATDPDRLAMAATGCLKGYNHLMDTRYEVRDAQYFLGRLADEHVVQPTKIGAFGGSYGGGLSMALAALKDRVMMPDGSLVPWKSPGGADMAIAAATPEIPWTDLANALLPNGATLDYVSDATYGHRGIGVMKSSFVSGLFATGLAQSNFAAPGTDPSADVISWYSLITAGEPYDTNPLTAGIAAEVSAHHSSYGIDHSEPPAPLLMSNGWTDDLFPADETIRFYNRTRTQYPGADLSLFYLDYGHQRGQNKAADIGRLRARQNAWFDYFLKGVGAKPFEGVETLTQTCPSSAPSGGPYFAPSWREIAPGELRGQVAAAQTILPLTSDPTRGESYDPVAGPGACATAPSSDQTGAANLRFDPAPAGGYTLMGAPTVVADISAPLPTSQIAARLIDVPPDGGPGTLVARGTYRPTSGSNQVFQLHPNGYKFEAGHVAKLELLPNDVPYSRPSNGQGPITISNLELRLPVLEQPNGGLVCDPAPKIVPPGYDLAPGYPTGSPSGTCTAANAGGGGGGGGGGSGGGTSPNPAPAGPNAKAKAKAKAKARAKKCAKLRKAKAKRSKLRRCKPRPKHRRS